MSDDKYMAAKELLMSLHSWQAICVTPISVNYEQHDIEVIAQAMREQVYEAGRELERRGQQIADAMGRFRGMDTLVNAVKMLSEQHGDALVEIDRLRAEVAGLKTERDSIKNAWAGWLAANGPDGWIDDLRKDNDRLRAEVAEIKAVLAGRNEVDDWRKAKEAELHSLRAEVETLRRENQK